MYGFKKLPEILKVPFEISNKILKPYIAKYVFYVVLKIWRIMMYQSYDILSLSETGPMTDWESWDSWHEHCLHNVFILHGRVIRMCPWRTGNHETVDMNIASIMYSYSMDVLDAIGGDRINVGGGKHSIFPEICTEHDSYVIMSAIASQITGVSSVSSAVCSGADRRKHQCSASLAFVRGIHRSPVNSPHKGPVTRKLFLFDDVIMDLCCYIIDLGRLVWCISLYCSRLLHRLVHYFFYIPIWLE